MTFLPRNFRRAFESNIEVREGDDRIATRVNIDERGVCLWGGGLLES